MTKENFYINLHSIFKVPIQDDTLIPNTPKLWRFFEKKLGMECDETIGERTAKNLYQIYRENRN